ncbi:MAG: hypothetical protein R2784_18760 [Saprospiraceae bacterium]
MQMILKFLSSTELEYVAANISTPTSRLSLEEEISDYGYEMSLSSGLGVHYIKTDTIIYDPDTLRNWLTLNGQLASYYEIIGTWLHEGNISQAQSVYNNMPNIFTLSSAENEEYQNYQTIIDLFDDCLEPIHQELLMN